MSLFHYAGQQYILLRILTIDWKKKILERGSTNILEMPMLVKRLFPLLMYISIQNGTEDRFSISDLFRTSHSNIFIRGLPGGYAEMDISSKGK